MDDVNGVGFEENMPTRRVVEVAPKSKNGFADALMKMHIVGTPNQANIVLLATSVVFIVSAAVVFMTSQPTAHERTSHQADVLQAMKKGTFPPPEIN